MMYNDNDRFEEVKGIIAERLSRLYSFSCDWEEIVYEVVDIFCSLGFEIKEKEDIIPFWVGPGKP